MEKGFCGQGKITRSVSGEGRDTQILSKSLFYKWENVGSERIRLLSVPQGMTQEKRRAEDQVPKKRRILQRERHKMNYLRSLRLCHVRKALET